MRSKKDIIKLLATHKNDVGSTEVQIGIQAKKSNIFLITLKNLRNIRVLEPC